jgi:hypothetical protein
VRQPVAAFRHLQQAKDVHVALAWTLLSGFCMVLLWADVFNLGLSFDVGQVMSVTLILGPVVGLLSLLLTSLLSLAAGRLWAKDRPLRYATLLAWNSKVMRPWGIVAAMIWIEHFILDLLVLQPGGSMAWLCWVLPLPCIGLWAYHSALALHVAYNWSWLRSGLVWGLAWSGSVGLLLFLLSFVMGIPLF